MGTAVHAWSAHTKSAWVPGTYATVLALVAEQVICVQISFLVVPGAAVQE
jgi:hypothetical protein